MKKVLALFDFDGTITFFDSTYSFYKFLYKSELSFFFNHYILCLWHLMLYRLRLINYLILKEKRLDIHTSRYNNADFFNLTEQYYEKVFYNLLNPKAIERINWHKSQGHDVWVISASFDFLLHDWVIKNNIKLITNKTVLKGSKRCIVGKDVNYDAKIEYLQLQVNLDEYADIYAYGDSDGDKAMLSIANFKFYKPFTN
jgi:phosphatidylglycerophosphatase C